jgi:quinol monooxygenase YgiN
MKFAPDRFAAARDILLALVERTRVTSGCLGCEMYQDLRDRHVLLLEEWWETQADLDRHLRSDAYGRVILVMEMATEHPLIKFCEISQSSGLEIVEKARRCLVTQ